MKKISTLTAIATAAIAASASFAAPAQAEQNRNFWIGLKDRIAAAQATAVANPETSRRAEAAQQAMNNHY